MVNQYSGIGNQQDGIVNGSTPMLLSPGSELFSEGEDDSIQFDLEQYLTFDHPSPDMTGVAEYDGKQIPNINNDGEMNNGANALTMVSNENFTFQNDGFRENAVYFDGNNTSSNTDSSFLSCLITQIHNCSPRIVKRWREQECKRRRQRRMEIVKAKRVRGLISSKNSRIRDQTRQASARNKPRNQYGQFQST